MSEPKVIKRMAPTFISPEINLPVKTVNKTKGQQRELDYLKQSKVLGPLLKKDEAKGKVVDPLSKKKKSKKEPKKESKKCKGDMVKAYIGQGRKFVLSNNKKKLYIEAPKKK